MNKHKHLEMIQNIINRLSNTSFLLKGWGVTLVIGLFALIVENRDIIYIIIAFLAFTIFWFLDGYFISQERLFRSLYDEVRTIQEFDIDFSMYTEKFYKGKNTWLRSLFSITISIFYLPLILIMCLFLFLI